MKKVKSDVPPDNPLAKGAVKGRSPRKQAQSRQPLPERLVADRLLSVRETARQMNWCLDTVRRHLRSGLLKGSKVGRNWRIPQSQLAAFCRDGENAFAGYTLAGYAHEATAEAPGQRDLGTMTGRDLGEDVVETLLRTKAVRQRVLELTRTALQNIDAHPDASRETLLHFQDLLLEL